jgi:transposase-like protein
LRYSLTYRDLEEIMAERGLSVDHVTIWRWVQRYAPVLISGFASNCDGRIGPGGSTRRTSRLPATGHEYLYRAVDSAGETIEFMLSPKRDLVACETPWRGMYFRF